MSQRDTLNPFGGHCWQHVRSFHALRCPHKSGQKNGWQFMSTTCLTWSRSHVAWFKFHQRRNVLTNKHISIKLRLKLFDAVVIPPHFFDFTPCFAWTHDAVGSAVVLCRLRTVPSCSQVSEVGCLANTHVQLNCWMDVSDSKNIFQMQWGNQYTVQILDTARVGWFPEILRQSCLAYMARQVGHAA